MTSPHIKDEDPVGTARGYFDAILGQLSQANHQNLDERPTSPQDFHERPTFTHDENPGWRWVPQSTPASDATTAALQRLALDASQQPPHGARERQAAAMNAGLREYHSQLRTYVWHMARLHCSQFPEPDPTVVYLPTCPSCQELGKPLLYVSQHPYQEVGPVTCIHRQMAKDRAQALNNVRGPPYSQGSGGPSTSTYTASNAPTTRAAPSTTIAAVTMPPLLFNPIYAPQQEGHAGNEAGLSWESPESGDNDGELVRTSQSSSEPSSPQGPHVADSMELMAAYIMGMGS